MNPSFPAPHDSPEQFVVLDHAARDRFHKALVTTEVQAALRTPLGDACGMAQAGVPLGGSGAFAGAGGFTKNPLNNAFMKFCDASLHSGAT